MKFLGWEREEGRIPRPILEGYRCDNNYQIKVWCRYCLCWHYHGYRDWHFKNIITQRCPHCSEIGNNLSPLKTEYIIVYNNNLPQTQLSKSIKELRENKIIAPKPFIPNKLRKIFRKDNLNVNSINDMRDMILWSNGKEAKKQITERCKITIFNPCIYFLCEGDEIVYIGQSTNFSYRIYIHLQRFIKVDHIYYQYVKPEHRLNKVEKNLINLIKPKYNIRKRRN